MELKVCSRGRLTLARKVLPVSWGPYSSTPAQGWRSSFQGRELKGQDDSVLQGSLGPI